MHLYNTAPVSKCQQLFENAFIKFVCAVIFPMVLLSYKFFMGGYNMAISNMQAIKQSNYSAIYKLLYTNDKLSKQLIAEQLQLSLPTVSTNLQDLLQYGLIKKNGKFESQMGRRATAYSINPTAIVSLGVEIFFDHATIVLINTHGNLIDTSRLSLMFNRQESYFKQFGEWINKFIKEQKLSREQIAGIGIGIQGLVSNDGQTILYGKILNCTGLSVEDFKAYLDYDITFYHDADCVAVAEQNQEQSNQDAIYLSIGEHLGTSIMVAGQIYSGQNGRSGTMEHVTLDSHRGRPCYCGKKGCIETYCSLSSLLVDNESATAFFNRLSQNDADTMARWQTYLDYLADAINNLHMFVDNPIVIAGEIVRYIDQSTINDLAERTRKITAFPDDHNYLVLGKVTDYAVAIGAGLPKIEEAIDNI